MSFTELSPPPIKLRTLSLNFVHFVLQTNVYCQMFWSSTWDISVSTIMNQNMIPADFVKLNFCWVL
jgi:hypothetical protein